MRISMVVAASTNNVIGRDGGLPWHIPEDLKHFKAITLGHPIVMGRRTFESIGRALPGRVNIVLTTRTDCVADGCAIVRSPAAALAAAGDADEVMIIGGGQVYSLFLPMADRIYMTRVETEIEGDTFFPALPANEWRVSSEERFPPSPEREHAFSFQNLERMAPPRPAGGG